MQPGLVEGDNPEETKKQKSIKGLLNKLTPEMFDKILDDVIDVGYEREETMSGLVDQVLPALFQPSFLLPCPLLMLSKCKRLLAQFCSISSAACMLYILPSLSYVCPSLVQHGLHAIPQCAAAHRTAA